MCYLGYLFRSSIFAGPGASLVEHFSRTPGLVGYPQTLKLRERFSEGSLWWVCWHSMGSLGVFCMIFFVQKTTIFFFPMEVGVAVWTISSFPGRQLAWHLFLCVVFPTAKTKPDHRERLSNVCVTGKTHGNQCGYCCSRRTCTFSSMSLMTTAAWMVLYLCFCQTVL